jgi:hypothetical protein
MVERSAFGLTPSRGGSGQIESTIIAFTLCAITDLESVFEHKEDIVFHATVRPLIHRGCTLDRGKRPPRQSRRRRPPPYGTHT